MFRRDIVITQVPFLSPSLQLLIRCSTGHGKRCQFSQSSIREISTRDTGIMFVFYCDNQSAAYPDIVIQLVEFEESSISCMSHATNSNSRRAFHPPAI